jgi:putative transposase
MPYPKTQLTRSCKNEPNPKVKERLPLVLKVKFDKVIPAYAADNLHGSRPWALYWLDRFSKERILVD